MKRTLLLSLSILFALATFSQTTATDFTVEDCSGNTVNLFSQLDEGKVVVIAWVMPWAACIGPALESYQVVQTYVTSNPGQVLYYMADDYANTACSSIKAWANNNSMGDADAYFSDAEVSMSDYGTPGMPKVIVVGCSEHKVYYNKNYTASGIGEAIDEALLECNAINTSVAEIGNNSFNINLFPNPAQNIVNVSYEMKESSLVTIDVINMMGETAQMVSNSVQNAGTNELQFDTEPLKDGLYLLRIQSNKGSQVVKFSVAH